MPPSLRETRLRLVVTVFDIDRLAKPVFGAGPSVGRKMAQGWRSLKSMSCRDHHAHPRQARRSPPVGTATTCAVGAPASTTCAVGAPASTTCAVGGPRPPKARSGGPHPPKARSGRPRPPPLRGFSEHCLCWRRWMPAPGRRSLCSRTSAMEGVSQASLFSVQDAVWRVFGHPLRPISPTPRDR